MAGRLSVAAVLLHWLIDVQALLVLVGANTAPILAARALGSHFATPIDAGRRLPDGRPLFGSHKTWRGFASAIIAAALIGTAIGLPVWLAAATGALALTGDLLSSFAKRRFGRTSGAWCPGLDQLPEALLPLFAMKGALVMTWPDVALTAAIFTAAGSVTSRLNDVLARRK
jgi:CDP-2,3-bis-(O-geranylgeranyl)-sn-glycerol synthase